ncbi:protein PXR1-like [Impatiens glandulifera]|uniref:protein PXR1-like n=1 Tax=Impatiens glandulifera TaxID=253017 RepID=UPI001FB0826E|nr:protein PXR1-like [Impatiens glandulifera]
MRKKKNNKAKEVKEFVMEGLKEIAKEVVFEENNQENKERRKKSGSTKCAQTMEDEQKILKGQETKKNQEKETRESKSKKQNVEEENKETIEEDTQNNQAEVDVTKAVVEDIIDESERNKDKNSETDLEIQVQNNKFIPLLFQKRREEKGQGENEDNLLIQQSRLFVLL